jgi:hypothetical protein
MHLLMKETYYIINMDAPLKALFVVLMLLFFSSFSVAENSIDSISTKIPLSSATLDEVKTQLDKQQAEWNDMKPALKRLIQSEQDLALIIAALEKTSPLASQPSDQQLLDKSTLSLPEKKKIKPSYHVKVNPKPQTIVQIGIHLASYKEINNVEPGWVGLKNKFKKQLKAKTPFYYQIKIEQKIYTRLVVGPFADLSKAREACSVLANHQQYCQEISYKVLSTRL